MGAAAEALAAQDPRAAFARPYVVSWNLTYRCNLACEHCYLDAGGKPLVATPEFNDRSELTTDECRAVIDQLAAFAPQCVTILTGGEPLLRRDILEIVRHGHARGLWIVVGTNGVKVTETLARRLADEGVRGLALSLDALDPDVHDRFRAVRGAWRNTVEGARILAACGLPFIVQTTVGRHNAGEVAALARFACEELGAKVWNLYFLVPTGRGQFVSDIAPAEYDGVLAELVGLQAAYAGRMLVNAKCAPHHVRTLLERDPSSPFLKAFDAGAGGCPAGTHYLGIRPNGDVTPCPYLPVFGGNVRRTALETIWSSSDVFTRIRAREDLGGRCGGCELNRLCGGCRARAYGVTGDLLAEDPLCTFEPGALRGVPLPAAPAMTYGRAEESELPWDPAARERLTRIPAFVRGMVVKRVESWCRERGLPRVTPADLDEIRSRMPASRLFGPRP